MQTPVVSVVMSVYNGARHLDDSVASVLSQAGVAIELIAVNDGSTDTSPALLRAWAARDTRVRVLDLAHAGLTRALIAGCAAARGRLIARQDADDRSLPDRLRRQAAYLDAHPEVTLVSCQARCIGPEGEALDEWHNAHPPEVATALLREDDPARARGVHGHGSTMFRRADYERVGGYRPEFYCAQDLDLWLRLTDNGWLAFLPDILYEVRYDLFSVGTRHRDWQLAMRDLIMAMRHARARGDSEVPWLARAAALRPVGKSARGGGWRRRMAEARGAYFIGTRLLLNRDCRAGRYLQLALRRRPWHARSWWACWRFGLLSRGWRCERPAT